MVANVKVPLENAYKFLAPRPIVLITTVDKQGRINAAPMSWVTPVESDPLILAFSTSYESDTYRNAVSYTHLTLPTKA